MAGRGSKPGERRGGRAKGTPNKTTSELKDMILQALDEAGGVDYLKEQAERNPAAFLTSVGKIVPRDIKAEVATSPTLEQLVMASMKTIDGEASEVREETPRLPARRV